MDENHNDELTEIFHLVTTKLKADLNDDKRRSAGIYNAAIRFLSDNKVEALAVPGSDLAELAESIPFPKTGTD